MNLYEVWLRGQVATADGAGGSGFAAVRALLMAFELEEAEFLIFNLLRFLLYVVGWFFSW